MLKGMLNVDGRTIARTKYNEDIYISNQLVCGEVIKISKNFSSKI